LQKTNNINKKIPKKIAPHDAAGEVQKMKKENKKAITIRIDQETLTKYDETLQAIYGKKQRKKSTTIESLINQFNNQDNNTLQQYLLNDKPIINLNTKEIQQYQQEIQELHEEIQSLKDKIAEQEKYIESSKALDNKEIQSLKSTIQEKNKIIEQYNTETINHEKNIESVRAANNEKDKRIDELLDTIKQQEKDIKTARNDYKHSTENLNKLHDEINDIQNENKEYAVAFAEIKKMSIIERITARYPKKFLELTGD